MCFPYDLTSDKNSLTFSKSCSRISIDDYLSAEVPRKSLLSGVPVLLEPCGYQRPQSWGTLINDNWCYPLIKFGSCGFESKCSRWQAPLITTISVTRWSMRITQCGYSAEGCHDEEGIELLPSFSWSWMGMIEPELTVRISVFTKPFQLSL